VNFGVGGIYKLYAYTSFSTFLNYITLSIVEIYYKLHNFIKPF